VFTGTRIWEPVQCQTLTRVYVNAALMLLHGVKSLLFAEKQTNEMILDACHDVVASAL